MQQGIMELALSLVIILAFVCAILTIAYCANKILFPPVDTQDLDDLLFLSRRLDRAISDTAEMGYALDERLKFLERHVDAETNKDTK